MTFQRFAIPGLLALLATAAAIAQTGPELAQPSAPSSQPSPEPQPFSPESAKGFFTQYCFACHNQYAKMADVVLDTRDFEHVAGDAEIWERVVRKLRAGAMPPQGMPRPDRTPII